MLVPITVHNYYLNTLYPLPFLLAGSFLVRIKPQKLVISSIILIIFFILVLIKSDVYQASERNLAWQKQVASAIAQDKPENQQFNIVAFGKLPFHSAWEYRFLVRNFGFKSLTANEYDEARALYLVAEVPMEEPLKAKSYETVEFAPQKVEKAWKLINGWQIFKLIK